MTDTDRWLQHNQHYLTAALHWLRLRLQGLRERSTLASPDNPAPPALTEPPAAAIAQAATALEAAAAADPPPAMVILSRRLDLSPFEQQILLLCVAMELDLGLIALCAEVQRRLGIAQTAPTFSLALLLFADPAWDALTPERPLRYWQLLEINQPVGQPLLTSPLRADERIVNYLKGLNALDDRLEPFLSPLALFPEMTALPPSQQAIATALVHRLKTITVPTLPPVQLLGPDPLSKQLVARAVAAALGLHLYRLPAELLPSQSSDLETLVRLWRRETLLLPVALYLDAQMGEGSAATEGQITPLQRLLSRPLGLCFLSAQTAQSFPGPTAIVQAIAKPDPVEQQMAWVQVLGPAASDRAIALAGQFNLNWPEIAELGQASLSDQADPAQSPARQLWERCLQHTQPRLDTLAQRLEAKATWNDIVLPAAATGLLRQIADQVKQRYRVYEQWGFHRKMNRGLGISALFAGDSGTGKTMAAEVIANDLNLNLYRIDLSAVVSKYIGETEKNLRRLFDAAEDGGAILFFDEADALFGKRSEVKDAHDRYANIEINYLLQRMEAYRGLAILATNFKSALDKAFLRRLRFLIEFPFPGMSERQQIWQRVFPPETPTAHLDCDRLARFNLTGGSIHNIALNATFMAAAAATPVTMALVLAAIRTEFDKLERPINEAEFQWAAAPIPDPPG